LQSNGSASLQISIDEWGVLGVSEAQQRGTSALIQLSGPGAVGIFGATSAASILQGPASTAPHGFDPAKV